MSLVRRLFPPSVRARRARARASGACRAHDRPARQTRSGCFCCERRDGVLPSCVLTEREDTCAPTQGDASPSPRGRRRRGAFVAHTRVFRPGRSRRPAARTCPTRRAPAPRCRSRDYRPVSGMVQGVWSPGGTRRAPGWPRSPSSGPRGACHLPALVQLTSGCCVDTSPSRAPPARTLRPSRPVRTRPRGRQRRPHPSRGL